MIIVHHLNNSRSQRVLWLLEELGLPYEIKRYQRNPKTMLAPPELLAVHPLGKSPVITDGGHTVAETGAIMEYIVSRYGGGRMGAPTDEEGQLRYTYWMHFAEGSAMPPLVMTLLFGEIPKRVPFPLRPFAKLIGGGVTSSYLRPTIAKQLDLMEAELGKSAWFAGANLTAADVMMSFPLEAAGARIGLTAYPKLEAWVATIHGRAAYRRALEKGGAYAYA
ncbi:glutathione S-transferase family protein [Acidisoma cladoniae]|jgi:glutathione S-transferase|uniref:glutathione S-transferase family protein n=1 Tax=Acidisoma cladoniae TaxID=3040935 RepID=UPI00255180E3|nr:glutathione S-transferase [Acidisoma sp. PAMC 29798]